MRPFPRVVRIEPASACNLRCSHCPTGTVQMTRGVLKWDDFLIILNQIKKYSNDIKVLVLYHGGEPFLNPHFFKMVSLLRKVCPEAMIKTVTNGMLLNDDNIHNLIDCGLDEIEFSLDGTSPGENNFIRRNSDFHIIKDNIHKLIQIKKKQNCNLPNIWIATTQFIYHHDQMKEDAPIPDYLQKEFFEGIQGFKSTFAMRWPDMVVDDKLFNVLSDPDSNEATECDHVLNTITIRWNGDVVPCCYDLTSQLVMGNILEDDLVEIWNNESYAKLIEGIKRRKLNRLCNKCNTLTDTAYLLLKSTE
ncbi:radical SAM protein with 4Fe4S-binding SPASM domain [Methanocalculus alkaliphilus]|uniref:radical SAM/SPASM domain-containing protein n=1 Tax=Methanocalculus alkaliphilus TaxID=768730 RepID=UPI00209E4299|nr:radical SAM protein [Methanocalculus alkaliphilus]MCP1716323.1 radical SAM protein with 4Fe4S-binding SPASM domain [Methanocalculus alkaliphilus]